MTSEDKRAALAAALFIAFVALGLWLMPSIMIGVGERVSPLAGALIALIFIVAPFGVLWLRARAQRRAQDQAGGGK